MNTYRIKNTELDSVELKCLLVSRGLIADPAVYQRFADKFRISPNPMTCNSLQLSDRTVVQVTDLGVHFPHARPADSLSAFKLGEKLGTFFSLKIQDEKPALFYGEEFLDFVTFPSYTDFYTRATADGHPYLGNAVLQGVDWVAFQCLWPCEYAAAGEPCQYCFCGAENEAQACEKRPLPPAFPPLAAAEIIRYAVTSAGCKGVQITGGSTFSSERESEKILSYLAAIEACGILPELTAGVLLYITPPENLTVLDRYMDMHASRIACSLEVWDEARATVITPGKIKFTTRKRHLDALEYIVSRYGIGKAFSNFIIGIEPLKSLLQGASYLAERGILPSASIWMPMGRPVMGSTSLPELDYYRRVKEAFAELYVKYRLEPAGCSGLNVCMERDIYRFATGCECR